MPDSTNTGFGDNVRIVANPATETAGVAGLVGHVCGETVPSVTAVEVIGQTKDDYAVNVFFKERNESFWFVADLLEFVDHGPGTTIEIGDPATKWVRTEQGEWVEVRPETYKSGFLSWLRRAIRRR
jgi:hypothetical protein